MELSSEAAFEDVSDVANTCVNLIALAAMLNIQ